MNNNRNRNIVLHVIGCIAFLVLTILLSPRPPQESFFNFSSATQRDIIANVFMLCFFYLNYYLLIPALYFRKKYVVYFICLFAGLLLICFVPTFITDLSNNKPPLPHVANIGRQAFEPPQSLSQPSGFSFLPVISHHIFLFFAVALFSLLLRIRTRLFNSETARNDAELSYLKAQINPHFLFNTLNSIYSLAIAKDDKTADAVIQLSELMRYVTRDAHNEYVPLEKEINYIENYIALQRTRFGDTVSIEYSAEGEFTGKEIAPLILITFIENAFKHGINPDEKSEIVISIRANVTRLQLIVRNRKVHSVKSEEGIGVQNTLQRLKVLYPSKHEFKIYDKKDTYMAELLIQLQ